MWRAYSGLLAVAVLGAMASSVEAQTFLTPLSGEWLINIPEEPYGPRVWTLEETSGVVTGETEIHDIPGVDITGEMSGKKLFLVFYLLSSQFGVDSGIEGIPEITASNVAFVWVFMGKVQGFAISTIDGVPLAAYQVTGQKK